MVWNWDLIVKNTNLTAYNRSNIFQRRIGFSYNLEHMTLWTLCELKCCLIRNTPQRTVWDTRGENSIHLFYMIVVRPNGQIERKQTDLGGNTEYCIVTLQMIWHPKFATVQHAGGECEALNNYQLTPELNHFIQTIKILF